MKDIYISDNRNSGGYRDVYSDSSGIPQNTLRDRDGNPISVQGPPDMPPGKKKKKKRKKSAFGRIVKALIAVFVIVTVLISVIAGSADYTKVNLKRNAYTSAGQLHNNPFITNILLIGTDEEFGSSSRSDSMILMSLDFIHRKIKLTSFLRDCYVEIPSLNKKMKINAACSNGGAQLVCDTIEYNFGIDIDHYLKVDFDMFTKIIDNLGGIDVEISEKEAEFINRTTRYTVKSGDSVHLPGAEALVYARIRKLDSDYMRTFRQRKIISALIDKMKHSGPATIINAFKDVLPLIETDLNALEITSTVYKGGIAALFFDIVQTQMPKEEMMTTGYAGSIWVEFPELDECRDYLYRFIYKNTAE